MDTYENIVVGSGPSGTITSKLISDLNKSVLMIDVGFDSHDKLKFKDPKQNFYKILDDYNSKTKNYKNSKNSNLKYPFGSNYVYKRNDFEQISSQDDLDYVLSNSYGGLSNIWANLVSPFKADDIKDWPIGYDKFYEYKADINHVIPLHQNSDFNDYFETPMGFDSDCYDLSTNGQSILSTLKKNKYELNNKGFFFGRSISSLNNKFSKNNTNCLKCGLCHFGCPNKNMFSSTFLLDELKKKNFFTYKNNLFVSKILKNNSLELIDVHSSEKKLINYKNLFICCGALSTAMLMLRSSFIDNDKIKLKESHRFFFPIINKSKPAKYEKFKNTLPELFFEIMNNDLGQKSTHMQLYSLSEVMLKPFTNFFGKYAYKLPYYFPSLNRMNILLGYLHSDYSGEIDIHYLGQKSNNFRYNLSAIKNPNTSIKIMEVKKFLKRTLGNDFYFPGILSDDGMTGSSYHYGASFPMSNEPEKNKNVDINACFNKDLNIYILDSSIFPTMPGSPTTYNTLVNIARVLRKISL